MDKRIKESEEKAMIRNKNIKEKLNMKNAKKIMQMAETRMAVHTHTHTHLSFSKYFVNEFENIKKNIGSLCRGRTVLWNNSMGLSLSAFINKRGRVGPVCE